MLVLGTLFMGFFLYIIGGLQARFGHWGIFDNSNVWLIEGHDSATKGIIIPLRLLFRRHYGSHLLDLPR
ncbi:hypothetical protein K435DRAFT_851074 [Dendrothele bispora CBS 962.96]|uniref:Uncharacterized protein n=1 Tax=Dendrothele bispora (strain CBS 962.96) TaxID=1314807 RepID=A0A4S8MMU2_DENBC|nr:hypothetical protein K435DRAFT_851074 [Dendrothele bispora CBS 962.96]